MKKSNKERMVTLRLPRISGKNDAVYISVGERSWRIRRGYDVTLPLCAYDVLRNSELAEDRAITYTEAIH
ncbi:MAG: hypothetical protein IKT46_00680 [Clostridia bacterium]|nr:hypothetical protein [Clostridia bacterium]